MRLRNERGLTLIELLATMVIISIVLAIVTSILVSSQNEGLKQTVQAKHLNDEKYALKIITKDIRRSTEVTINTDGIELKTINGTINYFEKNEEIDGKIIIKLIKKAPTEEQTILEDIGCVKFTGNSGKININISTNPDVTNCDENIPGIQKTVIQMRKGDG